MKCFAVLLSKMGHVIYIRAIVLLLYVPKILGHLFFLSFLF